MKHNITIRVESPLHLGTGGADVNLDAEVAQDAFGTPYFPAKRFRGMLYISALEVYEMFALCDAPVFDQATLAALFQRAPDAPVYLIIHDFHLADYANICAGWAYLQKQYAAFITPADVLESYTSVRYQTEIDSVTGVAKDTSLRNIRVVESGIQFVGSIEIVNGTAEHDKIVALALKNLTDAGMKQSRGFGRITCMMDETLQATVDVVLRKG